MAEPSPTCSQGPSGGACDGDDDGEDDVEVVAVVVEEGWEYEAHQQNHHQPAQMSRRNCAGGASEPHAGWGTWARGSRRAVPESQSTRSWFESAWPNSSTASDAQRVVAA